MKVSAANRSWFDFKLPSPGSAKLIPLSPPSHIGYPAQRGILFYGAAEFIQAIAVKQNKSEWQLVA